MRHRLARCREVDVEGTLPQPGGLTPIAIPFVRRASSQELYETFRHSAMKCGEDDDGRAVKMDVKYFLRYMATQRDDSPLYVFHSSFEDDKKVWRWWYASTDENPWLIRDFVPAAEGVGLRLRGPEVLS
jgi:hypothetical protein